MNYCEPYQSCALFGALRYFSNIKSAACLINGPTGCTFFNNSAMIRLNGYFNAPYKVDIPQIYCTAFNEADAILGCESKVESAGEEIIDKLQPSVLFIFNCCVSEIVGTDIDTVTESLSEKYSLPVIPVHTAGFKGDHKFGMRMACDILMERFFLKQVEIQPMQVNLLGEFDYFNRSTIELIEMLKKIEIVKIHHIPGKCSLEELYDAPNAALNIITCQNASRYLAEQMKEKFGIPYVGEGSQFYGMENSSTLYKKIYKFFNKSTDVIDQLVEETKEKLQKYLLPLAGKTAVIVASTRRSLGYASILKELGIKVELIFSEADEKYADKSIFLKYSNCVMLNEYPYNLREIIAEKQPDFIFSTIPELIAPYKYLIRPEIDYSGIDGVLRMAQYLCSIVELAEESTAIRVDD